MTKIKTKTAYLRLPEDIEDWIEARGRARIASMRGHVSKSEIIREILYAAMRSDPENKKYAQAS
jgi:hypothetical protein